MSDKFALTLDSSQINEYMKCPLMWFYHYKMNLRKRDEDSEARDKGTLIHTLLDIYYNFLANDPKCNPFQAANATVDIFKSTQSTQLMFPNMSMLSVTSLEAFLCDRFQDYVKRYAFDDFLVTKHNGLSPVELGFTKPIYEDSDYLFCISGRIDLIPIYGNVGRIWVDHKTQERRSDLYYWKVQFLTYCLATGLNWGMVNYFGLQKNYDPKITFRRTVLEVPNWKIEEWHKKLIHIFKSIAYILQTCKGAEETYFYALKNEASCAGAFESHPCMYTTLCETENKAMKEILKENAYVRVKEWQPY